jgi:hypothetical protein
LLFRCRLWLPFLFLLPLTFAGSAGILAVHLRILSCYCPSLFFLSSSIVIPFHFC